jgi:sensor histidine kinase YesM
MKLNLNNQGLRRIAVLIVGAHTFFLIIKIVPAYLFTLQNPELAKLFPSTLARLVVYYGLSALFTPLILWAGYFLPLIKRRLPRNIFFHLIFSIAFGLTHTYCYGSLLILLTINTSEAFQTGYFTPAALVNNGLNSVAFYAAIISVQQAYFYFRESQERAFRVQQVELEMLKTQLQKHFLFNALNAISTLVYKSPTDADQTITQLSDLLRVSLSNGKTQEVKLKVELEFLKSYLAIQQTLMKQRLQVKWKIENETLDALIPNMMLQPIVENAIKHGLAPLEEGGLIEISAVRCNGTLHLEMSDNGRGIGENEPNEGIGLSNTRARLKHLYGEEHRLEFVAPEVGGLSVKIEIPFREWKGSSQN